MRRRADGDRWRIRGANQQVSGQAARGLPPPTAVLFDGVAPPLFVESAPVLRTVANLVPNKIIVVVLHAINNLALQTGNRKQKPGGEYHASCARNHVARRLRAT